jgi:hypothetical protein
MERFATRHPQLAWANKVIRDFETCPHPVRSGVLHIERGCSSSITENPGNRSKSNWKNESSMTNSEYQRIQSNYEEYLQRYPDEGIVQTKLEYPLQSHALVQGGFTGNNRGDLERELLTTLDDSLPDVERLSLETLAKLPIELMDILKIQVTPDHRKFWKWTYWILEDVNEQHSLFPHGLVENLETLFRLSACSPIPSRIHIGAPHPNQAAWDSKGHESHMIYRAKHIAAYLSFPLLEGVLKSVCCDYIEMNGDIKQGKQIKQFSGGYSNSVCYRICDLLTHLEEEYAGAQLKNNLQEMRIKIGDFYHRNPNKVYKLIDDWRNASLHGQNAPDAEYGTILNLICLIIWAEMKPIF